MEIKAITGSNIEKSCIEFAVITARYKGEWLFCRKKGKSTWEIPGGHVEKYESAEEAARRELYEETGAVSYKLYPVTVYKVTDDSGSSSYGELFMAELDLPCSPPAEYEMEEVIYSPMLPEKLSYPLLQPYLFRYVQNWLNLRTSANELWDLLDCDRKPLGRTHRRGDPLERGEYHLTVHVWMKNSKNQFLLTKRAPNKGYSHIWESTGGSAVAGDDSLHAALREVKEETGFDLLPENGRIIKQFGGTDWFCDVWLFYQDFDLEQIVLQEGETCDATYATKEDILALNSKGMLVPYSYLNELLEAAE